MVRYYECKYLETFTPPAPSQLSVRLHIERGAAYGGGAYEVVIPYKTYEFVCNKVAGDKNKQWDRNERRRRALGDLAEVLFAIIENDREPMSAEKKDQMGWSINLGKIHNSLVVRGFFLDDINFWHKRVKEEGS